MTRDKAIKIRDAIKLQRESVNDEIAIKTTIIYPTWEYLVETGYVATEAGFRFKYGDQLYKTRQENQVFQSDWVPSVNTGALFEAIDEEHTGESNDIIPFTPGMAVEEGKYYSQNGVTYLCIRSSGNPLYHDLSALVGNYVETV